MSSNANYDFVVGHHPIFGTADTLFGTNVSSSNGFADLGNPTAEGTASFAEVLRLIRQYKPVSDGCIIERTHQQPAVNRWSPSGEHHADGSIFFIRVLAHISLCFDAAGCLPEWSRLNLFLCCRLPT